MDRSANGIKWRILAPRIIPVADALGSVIRIDLWLDVLVTVLVLRDGFREMRGRTYQMSQRSCHCQ